VYRNTDATMAQALTQAVQRSSPHTTAMVTLAEIRCPLTSCFL
jgi:hypothetical protein